MAQLKRLTVKGYKSIRALEDFELGSLNVLIGANGAGKSNFISLFQMLAALAGWRVYHFHDTSDTAPVRQAQKTRDNLGLKADAANLAPFLRRLREAA